jgi:hypothetical protein
LGAEHAVPFWMGPQGRRLVGRTPLFVSGRVGEGVTAVEVVYPDGHTSSAAVGSGYFLAWVVPTGDSQGRADSSPPVRLRALNAAGNEVGQLSVRGDGA